MQLLIAAHERDCAVAVHNGSAAVVAETCVFLKKSLFKRSHSVYLLYCNSPW